MGCRTGIAPASAGSRPALVTRRVTTPKYSVGRRGLAPRSSVLQTDAILRLAHSPLQHPRSESNRRAPIERRRSLPLDDGGRRFRPSVEAIVLFVWNTNVLPLDDRCRRERREPQSIGLESNQYFQLRVGHLRWAKPRAHVRNCTETSRVQAGSSTIELRGRKESEARRGVCTRRPPQSRSLE